MKKILFIIAIITSIFLSACGSSLQDRAFLFGSNRKHTLNDVMQSWVGSKESELVGSWGAPTSSYRFDDGSRILTWKKYVETQNYYGYCERSFLIDNKGIVSKWKYSGYCIDILNDKPPIPNSVPIPQPTL